jgi:acid stress-induced BolA-like protein IbaG/YrbA
MVDATWLNEFVQSVIPGADVHATDLNGGGDHWHVVVVSEAFADQRSFQRQRPILAAATPHIQSGVIHAFDLKCLTPGELAEKHGGASPTPFVPHQKGTGDHPASW